VYLLGKATTIEWEILATVSPPTLGELDLLIIDPNGNTSYTPAAIAAQDYTPPTDVTNGVVTYVITPSLEGFWRIRLVTGTANQYQILSKVEMYVFDNTTVTSPYSDDIGKPAPYDINYYLQGYVVPGELYGSFVASRSISLAMNAPGSRAICEDTAEFFDLTLFIKKNNSEIGTIVFAAESYTGVITLNPTLIVPGDKIQIFVGVGTADARIRDIAINLVGCCIVVPCTVL
jgi:hypothetical protein